MVLARRRFNLIITSGESATGGSFLVLLLLAAIIPYHATITLPEGTFPVVKRMNIETCLVRFDVHLNTIIRTEESRSMGARFLDDADLNTREQCLRLCCETENCDVFVFEEKSPGTCFLFQCGPPENFRCKFTRHSNYTSAVLSIPPPPQMAQPPPPPSSPLAAQIQSLAGQPGGNGKLSMKAPSLSQHELELVNLKDGGKPMGSNYGMVSSTSTPLPPLGVRLGEILTTPSSSTPKQQLPPTAQQQQCGHFEFPCHSGECIAVYNVCDGIPQCEDGSDEGSECPVKNSVPIPPSPPMSGRDTAPGLGMSNVNGVSSGQQPIMMIPSNPIGMSSKAILPMYQAMDYPQTPNRFALSLEQQQQQQQMMKPIMHRNREDPMTAPKPWPHSSINEPNYVDTANSHIFNHKGGLQLTAVNGLVPASQQYQETLPESGYVPASSVVRGGGGAESYLSIPGNAGYPQQGPQQFPPDQPQLQPAYKSVIPSQWLRSNTMRSSWPLQTGDGVGENVPPQEQYIQPPVQQRLPAVAMPNTQAAASGVDVPSSIALPQPANNQVRPIGTQANATPTAGNPAPSADVSVGHSGPVGTMKDTNGGVVNPNAVATKHKTSPNGEPTSGGAEYEEDTYDDTYPETTNTAGEGEEQTQTATQTEPPKKKIHKHHKHDHVGAAGVKQATSEPGSVSPGSEPVEQQKKKKKTKTIKKDKAGDHHAGSDGIVHEHLKALHKDLEIEFADHDGYADRPGGAMLSLTLGVLLTAAMGILLSCRMRVARRRIRRPGKSSYAHDADFLVNGMYL